jgi:CRISPR/Cas system endoribonuclease Cas6 (RAMP superfamily)
LKNKRQINSFEVKFHSPTFIRKQNISYCLPNPESFLYSTFDKLDKIYDFGIDKKDFKNQLKHNVYI